MEQVRIGLIGCGGQARHHMVEFAQVPRLNFVAASDVSAKHLAAVVNECDVQGFNNVETMLDSGLVDAVLIATPHFFHTQYSIAALQRGLHVLTEKPVAVTAKAASEVNDVAAQRPDLVYAAIYQQRSHPKWKRIKQLIDDGEVGKIQRLQWTATNWFRTQAYYDSSPWRATWGGEGGGILVNQCPHNLDMLCWLVGPPKRVHAHVSLGKYHDIEVEDEVVAYLEYPGITTGLYITSTGEAPGTDRLEIIGDRGRLVISSLAPSVIEFDQTEQSVSEFLKSSTEWMTPPPIRRQLFSTSPHKGIKTMLNNFVGAILDSEPLIAPASQGIHSVELANAILMSGLKSQPVNIPMDREAFDRLLQELINANGKNL